MGETPEVLGPYVIYERLGAGGMATVHRAEHVGVAGFRKPIALKRLLPHVADDPAMLEMFIHEARLASQLRHANVAATYDLGKVDDTYFIAMEYVPGPTLTQIMKQCGTVTGPMPVPIVVTILQQLLDALDHAHNLTDDMGVALGIIHRDISPSNIIVSTSGIVKLIDFGIAKAATGGVQTQTGMIKGKYAYIAPEYMQGHLDSRADLFGVGIIAHELLSTKRLFNAASDFETLQRLRDMPIVPPSLVNKDVPNDLDDIVLTALQRDPELRWQSASAMRTALTNVGRRLKGGIVSNQQLTGWVEWAFALDDAGDGDDDQTRARRIDRDASASEAADPTIPPPAPASRARSRLGRVTAEPAMDPYETMTGHPSQRRNSTDDESYADAPEDPIVPPPTPAKWPVEKPRSSPNIVRRSGQMPEPTSPIQQRVLSEEENPSPDLVARARMLASRTAGIAAASRSAQFAAETVVAVSSDDSVDTNEQTADAADSRTINRVLQPAKIGGLAPPPAGEPKKRRLDASEYEIEISRPSPPTARPPRPSTKELSPRDRLSMQLTVDEDAQTPEPVKTSPRPSEQSLDQALGSLDSTLMRERDSVESIATVARAPATRELGNRTLGGVGTPGSRSVGGGSASARSMVGDVGARAVGSGGMPPQRDSPLPLGSPPTPPPRNAGSPSSSPLFAGPPAMPATPPASAPPEPQGLFPPAQSAVNAFAPVAPTLMVAPVLSAASVINPSAPYDPAAHSGSNPSPHALTQVINPSAPVINPSAPFTPPRPGPSQPPFVANQLVVPTSMPLGGPSSIVAERAALIPSLPQRPPAPIVSVRPSAPSAKTIVAARNLTAPEEPSAANASTILADISSIPPLVPEMTAARVNAAVGPAHSTSIGSVSAAERLALDRVTPANPPKTAPMDERAKRPSQQPEQNYARALVLPDAPPPAAVFPAGEDSGEMLVAPGAAPPIEEAKNKDRKSKRVDQASEKAVAAKKRDKKVVLPAAPGGPQRWPWILLVILLLALGAGAYVFCFGFDLPQF